MLPPQTHGGLSVVRRHSVSLPLRQATVSNALQPSIASLSQCRGFGNWRRGNDYASHIDPLYRRFTRFRTLKTRAKLLEKLKRRGKFEWDSNQKPYFDFRDVRLYATHGRDPRWRHRQDPKNQRLESQGSKQSEDGYELSQKEKEWMEYMQRRRIDADPYEAVFGKRFEPFWNSLIPSWMKDEMGLQESLTAQQQKEAPKPTERATMKPGVGGEKNRPENTSVASSARRLDELMAQTDQERRKDAGKSTVNASTSISKNAVDVPGAIAKPSPYSEYTATSWDSWTNKTRRTEWDSQSGQVKKFVYDPVSNRMVQVDGPKPAETAEPKRVVEPVKTDVKPSLTAIAKRTDDMRSLINSPDQLMRHKKALEIPFKVSTPSMDLSSKEAPAETVTLNKPVRSRGTAIATASVATREQNSRSVEQPVPAKPAALSKLPASDMDLLTADDVRAKMGKVKQPNMAKSTAAEQKAAMDADFEKRSIELDSELNTILKDRELAKVKMQQVADSAKSRIAEWDQAEVDVMFERELEGLKQKKAKLLNDEHGLFHIERQKRELVKLEQRIGEVQRRSEESSATFASAGKADKEVLSGPMRQEVERIRASMSDRLDGLMDTLHMEVEGHGTAEKRLQTSLDRTYPAVDTSAQSKSRTLQPAVERMQSKELPNTNDLDDAAAHESTEAIMDSSASNVPKNWSEAADVLQANRVKRTAAKRPYPMTRWIDDMNARKAAYESSKAPAPVEEAAAKEKTEKLQKANDILESEVKEQKFRMQAHENRYAHKIRSLRGELETAYKQSAVHSEKHVERIRFLEAELAKANKAVGGESASIPSSKGNVTGKTEELKEMQGEGDFCPNITKFAGSEKWYKQPANPPTPSKDEIRKAEQKLRDQALVKEVREIYEREYGIIDTSHRQRMFSGSEGSKVSSDRGPKKQLKPNQVVEVESDVDLGDALAAHEKTQGAYGFKADGLEKELKARAKRNYDADVAAHELTQKAYGFKADGLEKELKAQAKRNLEADVAAQEKEAHDALAFMQPESAQKMERVIAQGLKSDVKSSTKLSDLVSSLRVRRAASSTTKAAAPAKSESKEIDHGVLWEEPPLYKVLAYDPGNDAFSFATTKTNFTGSETPISIPQALSQLYQPARFVPHFAGLQQEGWQVVYGTRDLLIFRKVKVAETKRSAPVESVSREAAVGLEDHGLHTLVRPMENAMAQEAAEYYGKYKPKPKEYDPTSIENGKLMPYENAMAQEAANAYDKAARSRREAINPIDGTTKAAATPEVSTGNFASPTGFVNHDPLFPEENSSSEIKNEPESSSKRTKAQEGEVEIKHYPRVHRQEPHFSGQRMRRHNDRHERHHRRWEESRRERKRGGALTWALTVGLTAAGFTYVVGVAAEMARQQRQEKERWQEVLEGRRSRWG